MTRTATALLFAGLLFAGSAPTALAEDPPAAVAMDPGAIVEGLGSDEISARVTAAEAASGTQDAKVEKALLKALDDDVLQVRAAVIEALAARAGASSKKTAAKALARRMAKLRKSDENLSEELLVIDALRKLAQKDTIDALVDDVGIDTPSEIAEARMMAVANVPDAKAIEALIGVLQKGRRRGRGNHPEYASRALQSATGERFGRDPDKWREWWKGAEDGFDFVAASKRRADQEDRQAEREERRARRGEGGNREGGERRRRRGGEGGDDGGTPPERQD